MGGTGIEASLSGTTCACCSSFAFRLLQVKHDGFGHVNIDQQVRC